jgi:hypothetical protein
MGDLGISFLSVSIRNFYDYEYNEGVSRLSRPKCVSLPFLKNIGLFLVTIRHGELWGNL